MLKLKDKLFNDFISFLTPSSITNVMKEMKQYQIEHHLRESEPKISKSGFLLIMKKLFPEYTSFNDIFTLIFNRFQSQKCILSQTNKNFSLHDITPEEEINIYDVTIALLMFSKCEFKQKLQTLYTITDYDDDGFINRREISTMIYRTNILFCEEENAFTSESTLIQQSLGYIKAAKALNLVLYHPGNLSDVLSKERFITFDDFYDAMKRIENYKYKIIPAFVNIKQCLSVQRKEKEFAMNANVTEDFVDIANELITKNDFTKGKDKLNLNKQKYINYENNTKMNMKKLLASKLKMIKRKNNNTNTSTSNKNNKNDTISSFYTKERYHNKSMCEIGGARAEYNKICHIEIPPCKIKSVVTNINSTTSKKLPKLSSRLSSSKKILAMKRSASASLMMSTTPLLRTYNEIINDINVLLDKTSGDELCLERLNAIQRAVSDKAAKMKNKVKSNNTFQHDFKMDFYYQNEASANNKKHKVLYI